MKNIPSFPSQEGEKDPEREQRRKLYAKMLYENLYEWKRTDHFMTREERNAIQDEAKSLLPEEEQDTLLHYSGLSYEEQCEIDEHVRTFAIHAHKEEFIEQYKQFRDYQRSKFRNNWFHLVFFTLYSILADELFHSGHKGKFEKKLQSLQHALDKLNIQRASSSKEEEAEERSLLIEKTEKLAKQVLKELYPHMSKQQIAKFLEIV